MHFEQPTLSIEAQFWFRVVELKLKKWKLNEESIDYDAYYLLGNNKVHNESCISLPSRIVISGSCLDDVNVQQPHFGIKIPIRMMNFNLKDDFKAFDRKAILLKMGQQMLQSIKSGDFLHKPESLCLGFLITFADLKKHQFHFSFCLPTLFNLKGIQLKSQRSLENDPEVAEIFNKFMNWNEKCPFFLVDQAGCIQPLSAYDEKCKFVFADSCASSNQFGWFLRNFLFAISCYWKLKEITLIVLRDTRMNSSINHHLELNIEIPDCISVDDKSFFQLNGLTGWLKNDRGGIAVNSVDLSEMMDPKL